MLIGEELGVKEKVINQAEAKILKKRILGLCFSIELKALVEYLDCLEIQEEACVLFQEGFRKGTRLCIDRETADHFLNGTLNLNVQ